MNEEIREAARNAEIFMKNDKVERYVAKFAGSMDRKWFLSEAEECICRDRENQYGGIENSFRIIACLWEAYLKEKCLIPDGYIEILPEDVGVMMALLKIGRIATGSFKEDSYVDAIGYLACAGELANSK